MACSACARRREALKALTKKARAETKRLAQAAMRMVTGEDPPDPTPPKPEETKPA